MAEFLGRNTQLGEIRNGEEALINKRKAWNKKIRKLKKPLNMIFYSILEH